MNFNHIIKTMGWPFTIVYLALIIGAIYFTFFSAPKALNSNEWPRVQGEVTKSEIIERRRTTKTGDRITVYSAKIHFQYTVDGKQYTANQTKWADHHSSKKIEQTLNARYSTGSNVTVYFNPNNPGNAVLQKGLGMGHVLTGLFLLVSIAAMAWALYRNAKKRRYLK
jgi:hypothetical protein